MPAGAVNNLIPFVRVSNVAATMGFYESLGFVVAETYVHDGRLNWARLTRDQAELMVARTSEPIDPSVQGVLFYLYSPDLAALRKHLLSQGLKPGEIEDGSPGPTEEMRVDDPDGYRLMVAQEETT